MPAFFCRYIYRYSYIFTVFYIKTLQIQGKKYFSKRQAHILHILKYRLFQKSLIIKGPHSGLKGKENLMGVFTRFKDIISSNINAILDEAEDPQKMLRMMIQEMEDTLIELKSSCALKISSKEVLEDDIDIAESKTARWAERARKALSIGEEDLAKEALLEKRKIQKNLEYLKSDLEEYDKIIEESKNDIIKLQNKLDEAIMKHDILIERSNHAKDRMKAQKAVRNSESTKAGERFRRFESAVRNLENEVNFEDSENWSLDKKFEKMETEEEIQSELDELKKEINQ